MLRIALVEDNDGEAALLRRCLERYSRERDVPLSAVRFSTASEFIECGQGFDLILLDIDLPGLSGMEMANLLRSYDAETPIVFVTNLAQYAIKGYEVNALDFMVKPVSFYGVAMCMDKAMRYLRRRVERHILVETRGEAHAVSLANLVYVMVTNHRLMYRLADSDEPLRTRGSLRSVEKELLDAPFVLISSSCLVNMNYIRSYRGDALCLANGETLYFSGPKRRMATEKIAAFFGGSI